MEKIGKYIENKHVSKGSISSNASLGNRDIMSLQNHLSNKKSGSLKRQFSLFHFSESSPTFKGDSEIMHLNLDKFRGQNSSFQYNEKERLSFASKDHQSRSSSEDSGRKRMVHKTLSKEPQSLSNHNSNLKNEFMKVRNRNRITSYERQSRSRSVHN